MKTKDKVALLLAGAALLVGGGLLWSSRGPRLDGEAALGRVRLLRRGMENSEVIYTLHPESLRSNGLTTSLHSAPDGLYEQLHALTRDRYLLTRWKPSSSSTPQKLASWEVREGRPEREDVIIGRGVRIGGMIFHY